MPHPSTLPPIDVPETDVWSFIFERKDKPFPDTKEIFTDGETGRTYTFAQLRSVAVGFGKGLKSLWNWQKGDVLAFFSPNNIDIGPTTAGLLWAGGVACTANPLYSAQELAFQLTNSKSKAIITQKALLKTVREAAQKAGIPDDRIILLGDGRDESGTFKHFTDIKDASYLVKPTKAKIDNRKDLAFLVYSSGTTGLPKGVCLSHYNVVANILQMAAIEGTHLLPQGGIDGKGDKLLGVVPWFHIYGLTCVVFESMYLGWQTVSMSRFDLEKACQLIQDYKITYTYIPPPVVLAFGKHPVVDKYDLTSLKFLHCAAAPLTKELTEEVWERLKIPIKQGFGLSETSPVTHVQFPDEWAKFIGSVGKLVPNLLAKIVDSEGNELPDGQEGELWVKGPNIFQGYLDDPEKTKACMSEDGYFKTGDIFRRDKHGNYYCVDRLKELIKYKGYQVPPAELEGYLIAHEDVADVCVIGVDDKAQATEVPRAYIVLRQGVEGTEEKAKELIDWLATKVTPQKKLRGGVRFIDEVPKSASGKILRRVLRDQVKQEQRAEGARL